MLAASPQFLISYREIIPINLEIPGLSRKRAGYKWGTEVYVPHYYSLRMGSASLLKGVSLPVQHLVLISNLLSDFERVSSPRRMSEVLDENSFFKEHKLAMKAKFRGARKRQKAPWLEIPSVVEVKIIATIGTVWLPCSWSLKRYARTLL